MGWIQNEVEARLVDDAVWQLRREVKYKYGPVIITALQGFKTDFASIPKFYRWRFDPQRMDYAPAAIIHDILYAAEAVDRKLADACFLHAMHDNGVGWWSRSVIYAAVRIGGGFTYAGHTRESVARAGLHLRIDYDIHAGASLPGWQVWG